MKKFVRLDSVLTIKKENGFYTWSRDGGGKFIDKGRSAARSAAASLYNGKEVYGWVLLSVKNYYDKIQR